jgi:hypothetical protein
MGAAMPGEWKDIPYVPPQFATPFTVEPNHVYYLGDFVGSTRVSGATVHGIGKTPRSGDINVAAGGTPMATQFNAAITDCRDNYDGTTKELRQSYPSLSKMPAISVGK